VGFLLTLRLLSWVTSGKRGLVLEKPRLLWVSLETIKTSKIQRLPGRPQRKVPWVQITQSTPKALSKHPRAFPEHLQSISRPSSEHSQSIPKSLLEHSEQLRIWPLYFLSLHSIYRIIIKNIRIHTIDIQYKLYMYLT